MNNASFGATLRVHGAAPVAVPLFHATDATQPVTLTWAGSLPGADVIRLENGHSFYHREFSQLFARTMLEKATEAANPAPQAARSLPPAVRIGETTSVARLLPTAQRFNELVSVSLFPNIAELLDDGIPNEPYTPTLKSLTVG